jgi:arginyl-tRNA synthetase
MDRAIKVVQDKGLTCEDRGALLVDLTKFKMDRAIVRKGGRLYRPRPE